MKKTYRSKFIEKLSGDGVLYERDILNMILSNAYGGKEMSDITDKLLARFPSVHAVITADLNEILAVDGVSEKVALYLITLGTVANRNAQSELKSIKNGDEFLAMLAGRFSGYDNEVAEFYFVNSHGKVIYTTKYTSGNADEVKMRTDEFISFITQNKPYGMYLAHNHVNCSCRPSVADDDLTLKIATVCEACDVQLFDHAIINSDGEIYSYSVSGRLNELMNE